MILFGYGGPVMFSFMAFLAVFSLLFYWLGRQIYVKRQTQPFAVMKKSG